MTSSVRKAFDDALDTLGLFIFANDESAGPVSSERAFAAVDTLRDSRYLAELGAALLDSLEVVTPDQLVYDTGGTYACECGGMTTATGRYVPAGHGQHRFYGPLASDRQAEAIARVFIGQAMHARRHDAAHWED